MIAGMTHCANRNRLKLTETDLSKIDPRFQAALSEAVPELKLDVRAPRAKPARNSASGEKVYRAVIYTEHPDSLLAINIRVNSILPRFVTAHVTLEDLIVLAKCKFVTYIDAGEEYIPLMNEEKK